MSRDAEQSGLNPAAISPEDAARLLTATAGRRIDAETVEAALAAGAPTLPDGRVNLIELAAWLEREACPPKARRRRGLSAMKLDLRSTPAILGAMTCAFFVCRFYAAPSVNRKGSQ